MTLILLNQQLNLDQAWCHTLIYSTLITRMGPESGQVPIVARDNSHRVYTVVSNSSLYVPTISSASRLLLACSLTRILTNWVRSALRYTFAMRMLETIPILELLSNVTIGFWLGLPHPGPGLGVVPSQSPCYTLAPLSCHEFVRAPSLFDLGDRPQQASTTPLSG